jgi:photosystem II stability/assembly factor-like uncharacterized protein
MKNNLIHAALSLFMLVVFTTPASSQWVKTNWSASTGFFELYSGRNTVFARTWDTINGGQMFLTADSGETWTRIGSADNDVDILSVVLLNSGILAGTWDGFFQSPLDNIRWNAAALTGIPASSIIWSVTMTATALFAGAKGSVYRSSDSGATWTEIKSGIPVNARITSFAVNDNSVFAGSDSNGVFTATSGGTSWTAVNTGLEDKHITQLAAMGGKLFAATLKGVYESDNSGTSWKAGDSAIKKANCFLVMDDQLFAGTDSSGVYRSADSGATWAAFNEGMPAGTRVWSLAADDNYIFAGTGDGVFRVPFAGTPVTKTRAPRTAYPGMHFRMHGSRASITFALSSPETVILEVYGLNGERVRSLVHKKFSAGVQSVPFNTGSIAPGSYVMHLTAGMTVYQRIVSIQR